MESKKQIYIVSFTIDEIRQLILRYIDDAQNIEYPYCLMRCTTYSIWHNPLITFYNKNKNKSPSKCDKFAFVILLSYPRKIIEELKDISELSLFGNSDDKMDFTYNDKLVINKTEGDYGENNSGTYDCICSYNNLCYIHYVENKHSGISLVVGSECINKHKLLSEEEYKKVIKNDKKLKERQLEIKEGNPIGYYQEQKRLKKEEKAQEKLKKNKERIEKKNEKLLKNGNFHICNLCKTNIITINLRYCHQCISPIMCEIKIMECKIIRERGLMECQNCDKKDICETTEYYLCKKCIETDRIVKCQTLTCGIMMVVDKNKLMVYCDECEKKITKCVECNKQFISENNKKKCDNCIFNELNACINIECVYCKKLFTAKKIDNWKKYCKDCYKVINELILNPSKCKCDLNMVKKNIKKDGINKGRIGLACANFPNGCNKFVMF